MRTNTSYLIYEKNKKSKIGHKTFKNTCQLIKNQEILLYKSLYTCLYLLRMHIIQN